MDDTTVSIMELACRDTAHNADICVLCHAVRVCVVDAMFQGESFQQI